ncbi:MAG: Hsp20/alpha crystallin family protein [Gammaproteobacteria bacterium]|nr:Hsp20/alpha crystallin family protein [Gammaproteobacteria bacterium]
MNMTRFDPWSVLDLLQRDLNGRSAHRLALANGDADTATVADWLPPVDVIEEQDRFVLRADLPGVDPEAIAISMDKGVLTVSGERQREASAEVDGIRRYERRSGKFLRRFTLPESADADGIAAKSTNGILEISIPKQPQVQARRITVEAA